MNSLIDLDYFGEALVTSDSYFKTGMQGRDRPDLLMCLSEAASSTDDT